MKTYDFQYVCLQQNQYIPKNMKTQFKKLQNINMIQTESTITETVESKTKFVSSFTRKQPKPFMPVSSPKNQIEVPQMNRKSGIKVDLNQILQINQEIKQQNEENLSQIINCGHIQPICKKQMSKSSCNELQDINFSKIEVNLAGAQLSSPQVACNHSQQHILYQQVFRNDQQANQQKKETSLEMYYRRFYKEDQRKKWIKAITVQSSFKQVTIGVPTEQMQNLQKKQIQPYQLRVIQPVNSKRHSAAQAQLSQLHSKELNYVKAKNSIKLKDYLYQTQVSSKIKMFKRKQAHQRKRIEKRSLISSFGNNQAPLNSLKRLSEKDTKYSSKSSEILQIVKSQILSELKSCNETIQKITEELKQVQNLLQLPRDQDLWKIFELKRNIEQRMSMKLKNALQDLRIKKIALQKKQKK